NHGDIVQLGQPASAHLGRCRVDAKLHNAIGLFVAVLVPLVVLDVDLEKVLVDDVPGPIGQQHFKNRVRIGLIQQPETFLDDLGLKSAKVEGNGVFQIGENTDRVEHPIGVGEIGQLAQQFV